MQDNSEFRPATNQELDGLSDLLKQFQPQSTTCTDAEVLYQCGWQAALQSRKDQEHTSKPAGSTTVRTFVSGLVAGLAASVLLMISIRIPPNSELATVGQVENEVSGIETIQHDSNPKLDSANSSEESSEFSSRPLDLASEDVSLPRRSSYLVSMFELNQPIIQQDATGDFDSRAVNTRGIGGQVLAFSADPMFVDSLSEGEAPASTGSEAMANTQTLGQMLFHFSSEEVF